MGLAELAETLRGAIASRDGAKLEAIGAEVTSTWLLDENTADQTTDLLIETLSDPTVYRVNGVEHLLFPLAIDFQELSERQRSRLLNALTQDPTKYTAEGPRLAAADILSRKYPPDAALKVFERGLAMQDPAAEEFAVFGLDVLLRRKDTPDAVKQRARALLRSAGDQ
jgi:hypothetical protein